MSFRVPSFNLTCRVWSRVDVPAGPVIYANLGTPRITGLECQLRAPGKLSTSQDEQTFWIFTSLLLVPKLTDLRDNFSWDGVAMNRPDLVEVPEGSNVFYTVCVVNDVAKGFANEYRSAVIAKNGRTPIPMP